MIIDQLNNASMYFGLGKRLAKALRYLQTTNFRDFEPGKYEVDGAEIYALVQQFQTGSKEKECLEAHHRYIDIHYMVKGMEAIEVANVDDLKAGEYDPVMDYMPMQGEANLITIHEGTFMIFYPQDAHMPGLSTESPQLVKKVVVKVLQDQ